MEDKALIEVSCTVPWCWQCFTAPSPTFLKTGLPSRSHAGQASSRPVAGWPFSAFCCMSVHPCKIVSIITLLGLFAEPMVEGAATKRSWLLIMCLSSKGGQNTGILKDCCCTSLYPGQTAVPCHSCFFSCCSLARFPLCIVFGSLCNYSWVG